MRLITLNFMFFIYHILDHVGASVLVRPACPVLGIQCGQVVGARVGGDAHRLPGPAFADATCITPSRQSEPRRIQRKMGMRIHFFILTLNSAKFLIILHFCRIRRHMMASLAPSSRHGFYPKRARRRQTSTSTRRTRPRRTVIPASTATLVSIQ